MEGDTAWLRVMRECDMQPFTSNGASGRRAGGIAEWGMDPFTSRAPGQHWLAQDPLGGNGKDIVSCRLA